MSDALPTPAPLAQPRVLIADDSPDVLDLLIDTLRSLDCRPVVAGDGAEAVAKFKEQRPDLCVLDVEMPRMTGIEVCSWIKSRTREALDFVPVILLTSREGARYRAVGLDAGADDMLVKPFVPSELRARARAMLRIKALQDDVLVQRGRLTALHEELRGRAESGAAEMERVNRLRRYLAPQFVEQVLSEQNDDFADSMRPRRKEISVLFAEIGDFIRMADQLEPEEVKTFLDAWMKETYEAAFEHGGATKFLGDGVMVLFNDPVEQPDHTRRAVAAALEMVERTRALDARMHSVLPEAVSVRIGVNMGLATVGNMGSSRQVEYTAIGSTVNLAARLQGLCGPNTVTVAAPVLDRLGAAVRTRNERRESMKGLAHAVRVAEVVSLAPAD